MVTAYKYARGARGRHLLPHRQLSPLRDMLLSLAEQHRALALSLDGDERWLASADALERAADLLRSVAS